MMEVEDDTPLTAETQSDEEQAIAQPYQNEQLPMQNGLQTITKRGKSKKTDCKCLGAASKDMQLWKAGE